VKICGEYGTLPAPYIISNSEIDKEAISPCVRWIPRGRVRSCAETTITTTSNCDRMQISQFTNYRRGITGGIINLNTRAPLTPETPISPTGQRGCDLGV